MYMRTASVLVLQYRRSSLFLTYSALPVVLSTICVRPPRPQEASVLHRHPPNIPSRIRALKIALLNFDSSYPHYGPAFPSGRAFPLAPTERNTVFPGHCLVQTRLCHMTHVNLYYALPGRQLLYNVNMPTKVVLFTGGRRDGDDDIVVTVGGCSGPVVVITCIPVNGKVRAERKPLLRAA
ncbi:hypothetical protein BC826DRAFT_683490 [Russula brevipes]|nr:hypothetical protein BC826DRAFT_683490 [Russula brevipes]